MTRHRRFAGGYRDTAVMNILRRRLWSAFPDADFTYGNITAADRKVLGLGKSHGNDAAAVAAHGLEHITDIPDTVYHTQIRKQKRSLHEATPRRGRKEPNRTARRNAKNTVSAGGIFLNDKVKVSGQTGWVSGFSGTCSACVRDRDGKYITVPGKSYKMVPIRQLTVLTRCNNWAVYRTETVLCNEQNRNCKIKDA